MASCRVVSWVAAVIATIGMADVGSAGFYTFDDIANGELVGQDGWVQATVPTVATTFMVADGGPGSSVKAASYAAGIPTFVVSRSSDVNWGHALSATASNFVRADFQYLSALQQTFVAPVGLKSAGGHEMGNNLNERGPAIGIRSGQLVLREVAPSSPVNSIAVDIATISGLDLNDWISLKEVIDPTANGGNGAGDLYYMNLTDGATEWTKLNASPVALHLLDLEPTIGGVSKLSGVAMWAVPSGAAGAVDNVDLTGSYAIPEPSVLTLLAFGVAGLLAYAWRKRKIG